MLENTHPFSTTKTTELGQQILLVYRYCTVKKNDKIAGIVCGKTLTMFSVPKTPVQNSN